MTEQGETPAGATPAASAQAAAPASPDMRALVEEIARMLVDAPDEVSVSQQEKGEGVVLQLAVAPNDLGKVIGKQGRTARSIRTLLAAASMKFNRRYSLEIVE
jgi:uncharacterized protein